MEKEQIWINYIQNYCNSDDTEQNHVEADKALKLCLIELGYEELVKEYEKVNKWYA